METNRPLLAGRIGHPEVDAAVAVVDAGFDLWIAANHVLFLPAEGQQFFEEGRRAFGCMGPMSVAGHGADEPRAPLAELVIHNGNAAVCIPAGRRAGCRQVGLQVDAAPDWCAVEVELLFVEQIGYEFDIALACAEEFIQAVVGLDLADMAAVAEVGRAALGDKRTARSDPVTQLPGSLSC